MDNFEYRYIYQEDILFLNEIQQFYLEHPKDKIIILSRETYFAKIALNQKIGKLDLINYDYFLLIRGLAIPIYNTNTKEKGRTVYTTFSGGYEIINTEANMFYDGSKYYNKNVVTANGLASAIRNCYWSSATAVSVSSGYGPYLYLTAPAFSSTTVTNPTLTIKSPAFYIRGSTSIFTSSAWSKVTDIRY